MIHLELVHRETEAGRWTSVLVDNGRRPPYLRRSKRTDDGKKYWEIITSITRYDGEVIEYATRFRNRQHAERWMTLTMEPEA